MPFAKSQVTALRARQPAVLHLGDVLLGFLAGGYPGDPERVGECVGSSPLAVRSNGHRVVSFLVLPPESFGVVFEQSTLAGCSTTKPADFSQDRVTVEFLTAAQWREALMSH